MPSSFSCPLYVGRRRPARPSPPSSTFAAFPSLRVAFRIRRAGSKSLYLCFLANRITIFTNIDTMGVVGHGLSTAARRPRPEDARSRAMRLLLLPTSWATPHPLGSIKFVEGGGIYITIHQGDLRGLSLPQHGATDIASTAAHGRKTPVLGQRACCPHHGRLPTRSV